MSKKKRKCKEGCELRVARCKLRDKIQGKMQGAKNRFQVTGFELQVKK